MIQDGCDHDNANHTLSPADSPALMGWGFRFLLDPLLIFWHLPDTHLTLVVGAPTQQMRKPFDIEQIRSNWPVERLLEDLGYSVQKGRSRCPLCDSLKNRQRADAMSVSRDGWCCFRCGEKGDVFSLYCLVHGVRFGEALKALYSGDEELRSLGTGAPRVPRVSPNRIKDLVRDNWERMNRLIQRSRDAKIAQAQAVHDMGGPDPLWDCVEADVLAERQWDMLDAAATAILYYHKVLRR